MRFEMNERKIVIAGGGPSGLACAYTLAQQGKSPLLIEQESQIGGLCRTINFHGYLFDIGGHRFFSKNDEIVKLWEQIMGNDMLHVERKSKIYYRKKFFKYPLSFFNVFGNLGLWESFLCVLSFVLNKYFIKRDESTLEGWITKQFGERLFWIFFRSYSEKLWGKSCENISSDWAEQRIRGLSLRVAIRDMFSANRKNAPTTLVRQFLYPRTGPGEFYDRLKKNATERGAKIVTGREVVGVRHDGTRILSVVAEDVCIRKREEIPVEYFFSSLPLPNLIKMLDPLPHFEEVLAAARELRFRSILIVNVILDRKDLFPDQWIYVHSPEVKLGRIQNYKNWSPAMVLDSNKTSLGLEYFCDEGDWFWRMNDVDLINFAVNEVERIGIVSRRNLIDGFVLRNAYAYPVYNLGYKKHVGVIREYLKRFSNFQAMGRSGLFQYDNSDHALYQGICAARNFPGKAKCDLWDLGGNKMYLES